MAISVILASALALGVSADPDKKATVSYGTAVIDAEIDSIWNSVEGYKTTNVYQDAERLTDTVSEWKMMWDENKMYFLIVVTDSQINSQNETFWQNDCTQLFISFNIWENFDMEDYDQTTNSLGIRWAVPGVLQEPDNFLVECMGGGGYLDQDDPLYLGIERAFKLTATGFIQEYAFDPRLYCSTFKLEAGQKGGVDFINDDSMAGSEKRDVLYHWSVEGDTWSRPENLSVFELAPKPAVVEEPAATPPAEARAAPPPEAAPAAPAPAPAAPAAPTSDSMACLLALFALAASGFLAVKKIKAK